MNDNQKQNLINTLYDFVARVSSATNEKTPEEVEILPAVLDFLIKF